MDPSVWVDNDSVEEGSTTADVDESPPSCTIDVSEKIKEIFTIFAT